MTKPVKDLQLSVVSSIGDEIAWPRYTISLSEMSDMVESRGAHVTINGASREQTIVWLRTAALALEQKRPLRVREFE